MGCQAEIEGIVCRCPSLSSGLQGIAASGRTYAFCGALPARLVVFRIVGCGHFSTTFKAVQLSVSGAIHLDQRVRTSCIAFIVTRRGRCGKATLMSMAWLIGPDNEIRPSTP